MSDAAPRFQFSLADVFAAIISLAVPAALIVTFDLKELDEPGFLGIAVGLGLLLGFCGAVQYRREWNSRSVWFVPPFLIFCWSLFLLPYAQLKLWPTSAIFFYPPVFLGVATGMLYQKKGRMYPIVAAFVGVLVGFILAGCFLPGLVRPRSAVNESMAAAAAKSLAEAQEIYHRTDYDNDGVLEYVSKPRGLYERSPGAADLQLIDPAMFEADATVPGRAPVMRAGYIYRALYGQGPSAPGGAISYIDNKGNQTGGYAFVIYPAVYKRTGFNTFIISSVGTIFQKDLGPQTRKIAEAMTVFDPDTTWVPSE